MLDTTLITDPLSIIETFIPLLVGLILTLVIGGGIALVLFIVFKVKAHKATVAMHQDIKAIREILEKQHIV